MLQTYKAVTVMMNLSVLDYYSLDFFKLIYIKQLGQYYYMNKVSGFKEGRLTKVELIQV